MTAINSGTAQNFYPGDPPTLSRNIDALIATVSQALKNIFEPLGPGETPQVLAISTISADFTEIYDVLATAIVGIHSASNEANAYNNGAGILGTATDETSRLAVSEDGINALTEIVQVQSVVRDITSEIVDFRTWPPAQLVLRHPRRVLMVSLHVVMDSWTQPKLVILLLKRRGHRIKRYRWKL